jgi:hypothetical protein
MRLGGEPFTGPGRRLGGWHPSENDFDGRLMARRADNASGQNQRQRSVTPDRKHNHHEK